jgi:hypothetical protein
VVSSLLKVEALITRRKSKDDLQKPRPPKNGGLASIDVRGWAPLAALPLMAGWFYPSTWPRWGMMWALAATIFWACKWLTWRRSVDESVLPMRSLGYLTAWPGLDANAFLGLEGPAAAVAPPTPREWAFAWFKLSAGLLFFFGLARLVPAEQSYLAGWVGLVGLALMLHFGLFHLLSCAWRRMYVDATPLMNWPAASTSLSEFWSRRWNRAFRDLAHRFLFRPLTPLLGGAGAVIAGFGVSGLLHDAVISLPAGAGHGLPTLYFLLQAAGIVAERSRFGRRLGLGSGWRGWLFAATMLLAPAPLLFHQPFVAQVVLPMMRAAGAL